MKKRVIGIALALTMMGGAPLLAKGPELHSAERTNAYDESGQLSLLSVACVQSYAVSRDYNR